MPASKRTQKKANSTEWRGKTPRTQAEKLKMIDAVGRAANHAADKVVNLLMPGHKSRADLEKLMLATMEADQWDRLVEDSLSRYGHLLPDPAS